MWRSLGLGLLLVGGFAGCMSYGPPRENLALDAPAAPAVAESGDRQGQVVHEQDENPAYRLAWGYEQFYLHEDWLFRPFVYAQAGERNVSLPPGDRIVWSLLDGNGTLVARQVGWFLDWPVLKHDTYSVQVAAYRSDGVVVDHMTRAAIVGRRSLLDVPCGDVAAVRLSCDAVTLSVPKTARRLVASGVVPSSTPIPASDQMVVMDASGREAAMARSQHDWSFGPPVLEVRDMQTFDTSAPWSFRWNQGPTAFGKGWVEAVVWTGVVNRSPRFPAVDLRSLPPMPEMQIHMDEAMLCIDLFWDCFKFPLVIVQPLTPASQVGTSVLLDMRDSSGKSVANLGAFTNGTLTAYVAERPLPDRAGLYWLDATLTRGDAVLDRDIYPMPVSHHQAWNETCVALPRPELPVTGCTVDKFWVPAQASRMRLDVVAQNDTAGLGTFQVLDAAGQSVPVSDHGHYLDGSSWASVDLKGIANFAPGNWTAVWVSTPGTTPSTVTNAFVDVEWAGQPSPQFID